jgi:hypothetical protein
MGCSHSHYKEHHMYGSAMLDPRYIVQIDLENEEACDECEGTGTAPRPNGQGKRICPVCNGRGVVPQL